MTDNQAKPQTLAFEWQDEYQTVRIEVTQEINWCNRQFDHIEIRSVAPKSQPLPITETGYLSRFTPTGIYSNIDEATEAVKDWLHEKSQTSEWRSYIDRQRQSTLF